jgi:hypothetical protein
MNEMSKTMNPNEWLEGHKKLLHPPFARMSTEDRLLRVVMMAYAKHHLDSQHIGYSELNDALYCEICNTIGDDLFVTWGEKIEQENNQPDIDDD